MKAKIHSNAAVVTTKLLKHQMLMHILLQFIKLNKYSNVILVNLRVHINHILTHTSLLFMKVKSHFSVTFVVIVFPKSKVYRSILMQFMKE